MALQTHQPSSSTSSPSSSEYYDVFLSFSGKDTFNTFTSHLYHALRQSGLQTYMANEDLREGDEIWPSLEKAITGSRISIPIFSLNYASSKWCLDELLKIMEIRETKGQTVYPVFFHVDPRDVRKQSGDFGKKFDELAQRFDQEIVDKWKRALRKAGELKGWDLENTEHGNESMLIQKVVKKFRETPFDVPENLVGIDLCVEELLNLINLQSTDVKFIGIWGMGGIGKTTAAKVVFSQIRHSFEASFFLQDIRETSIRKGLVCLQNKLLSVILNQELKSISSLNEGKSFIKKRLHLKKVLIVLDDVDDIEQLAALAGRPDWFGHGSRIIITSRDEHVLNVHKVHGIYKAKELNFCPSLSLFSKHAFGKDQPPDDFLELAKDVVHIAGGLPLALEVLGSFLSDKRSTTVWSSTLERLKKIPDNDIEKKLKISYDGLHDLDKEIFLDIACFFIGIDKEYATYIWEGCGFSAMLGIENLIQKSLVKIGNRNELRMHDQLRDVGRNIVRQESPNEPGKRSRLWSHDEVMNVLRGQEGTRNVRGLILKFKFVEDKTTLEDMHLRSAAFSAMSKLRVLQIDNAVLIGGFKKFPLGLRWLSWKRCPLASIPVNFCVEKLVVLDLSWSRIKQVWNDWPQNKLLEEMKVLNLSGCELLTETLDFSRLPNLEKLDLEGCIKLRELPPSVCNLKSLKNLSLSRCSNLYRLPNSIGNLRNLKTFFLDETSISELPDFVGLLEKMERLSVKGCLNLVKLPDSMGKMRLLRELSMDGTHIVKLPEDFGMLASLEELSLSNCQEFRDFTENFSRLPNLEKLNLQGCTELMELPPSICKLKSLKKLILSSCSNLNKLPDMFGSLEELEVMELDGCKLLCKLPDSIGNLRNLKIFSLKRCSNLVKLPVSMGKMRLLRGFFIDGTGIVKLPQDFGMLSSLMELSMSDCREFKGFPENFSRLPKLEKLNLRGCIELPCSICEMKSLKNLDISGCSNLNKVEEIVGSLTELEVLKLDNCKLLSRSLGWIGNMRFLKTLSLDNTSITELPNAVGSLEKIEQLSLKNCSNLVKLPDSMGKMKRLRVFSISGSSMVKLPEDFGMISSLGSLQIWDCREFRGFPENFGSLTRLFDLSLKGNSKMGMLPNSLSGLCSLERLWANGCNLSEGGIPSDIGKLSSLRRLYLSSNNFSSLPEMPTSLKVIDVQNCISLKSLPDLSDLKHLRQLKISNCEKLADIQGIENVKKFLQRLWVRGCSRALVSSVKKSYGQGGLPHLSYFSFDGSKIPDCFIPLKISCSRRRFGLEWEIGPTRLWNPEQHQNLITCLLCFVLTKTHEDINIALLYNIIDRDGQKLWPEFSDNVWDCGRIGTSKRHQDHILMWDCGRTYSKFQSQVKQGFQVSFSIVADSWHEMVVKEAGVHLVYEETAESTYKRIANAISLSLHDDEDDDDDDDDVGGEASSSSRKRKMSQLLYQDGKDVDGAEASSSSSRKRKKLQLMHHDDDVEILASLLGKMVLT